MVRAAQRAFDIDLARSFVVGDTVADLGLAECIGARCVLVRTGHGASEVARRGNAMPGAVYVADDLMAATSWILTDRGGPDEAA